MELPSTLSEDHLTKRRRLNTAEPIKDTTLVPPSSPKGDTHAQVGVLLTGLPPLHLSILTDLIVGQGFF